jgi:hypothetical protein
MGAEAIIGDTDLEQNLIRECDIEDAACGPDHLFPRKQITCNRNPVRKAIKT